MDYYNEIKQQLIRNEITILAKEYSKNKSDLITYYNVFKLLSEAGKCYGESIIQDYSIRLTKEIGKGYSRRNLYHMRLYYNLLSCNEILQTMSAKLSWSHYIEILQLKDIHEIYYYIHLAFEKNLSVRELRERIKNKEYERLDSHTKEKLMNNNIRETKNFIKNPILIKNHSEHKKISEKLLKQLIL